MKRAINIPYTSVSRPANYDVPLTYEIEKDGTLFTLSCIVDLKTAIPHWLLIRKFQVMSRLVDGRYLTLYNEHNDSKNLDCSLFIDKAYAAIMQKEKMLLHAAVPA